MRGPSIISPCIHEQHGTIQFCGQNVLYIEIFIMKGRLADFPFANCLMVQKLTYSVRFCILNWSLHSKVIFAF